VAPLCLDVCSDRSTVSWTVIVLSEKMFEREQHKACVSQMVRVTGVHNETYIEKTSGVAPK
jgi:hypothetical protein